MTFLYITEKEKTIIVEVNVKEAVEYIKNNRERKNLGIFSGNNKEEIMKVQLIALKIWATTVLTIYHLHLLKALQSSLHRNKVNSVKLFWE